MALIQTLGPTLRNRLSDAAHRRLQVAGLRADASQWVNQDCGLESARLMLQAEQREYILAGFTVAQIDAAMRLAVEACCNSLELGAAPRQSLECELLADRLELHSDATKAEPRITTFNARRVEQFLEVASRASGRRLTKTDFWQAAGDTDRTEFQRWQAEKGTESAAKRFERVLAMSPEEFSEKIG